MMRVFDTANAGLQSGLFSELLPATAEQGAMNRARVVATEFHRGFFVLLKRENGFGTLDAAITLDAP